MLNKKLLISLSLLVGVLGQTLALDVMFPVKAVGNLLAQPGTSLVDAAIFTGSAFLCSQVTGKHVRPAFSNTDSEKAKEKAYSFASWAAFPIFVRGITPYGALATAIFPPALINMRKVDSGSPWITTIVEYAAIPMLCGFAGLIVRNIITGEINKLIKAGSQL